MWVYFKELFHLLAAHNSPLTKLYNIRKITGICKNYAQIM
jgi:hypothetical protein